MTPSNKPLNGKAALVTGGSRGIGRAIAQRLARDGAKAAIDAKAAIELFTRAQSKELGNRGITVNAVLPGVTETELTDKIPAAVRADAAKRSSFGRIGQPDDIADIVAFLASHDARWITGQMLVANGGMSP